MTGLIWDVSGLGVMCINLPQELCVWAALGMVNTSWSGEKGGAHLLPKLSLWSTCNQDLLMFHWYYSIQFQSLWCSQARKAFFCWKSINPKKTKQKVLGSWKAGEDLKNSIVARKSGITFTASPLPECRQALSEICDRIYTIGKDNEGEEKPGLSCAKHWDGCSQGC